MAHAASPLTSTYEIQVQEDYREMHALKTQKKPLQSPIEATGVAVR